LGFYRQKPLDTYRKSIFSFETMFSSTSFKESEKKGHWQGKDYVFHE
jgi:hypothetical protein